MGGIADRKPISATGYRRNSTPGSAHDQIILIFRPRRYQLTAISYRHTHNDAFSLGLIMP
jgi:hypothetical protein